MFPKTFLIGLILESIFYGVYCLTFGLFLKIQLNRRDVSNGLLLVCALTAIFILCTAYLAVEVAQMILTTDNLIKSYQTASSSWNSVNYLTVVVDILYICIDFISQGILIYRCWIMWHRPLIVALPIILVLAFLATSLTTLAFLIKAPGYDLPSGPNSPSWFHSAVVSFFSMSLIVNAGVTGLIVFKILIVYREHQQLMAHTRYANGTRPHDFYPIISILVESGLITFIGQLVQTILYNADDYAFPIVDGVVVMLYGISPTIVLVRVVMGLSYDNEISTATLPTIHFAEVDLNDIHSTNNDPTHS